MSDLTFEPPGPGVWELNDEHFPRPLTRYGQELYDTSFVEAFEAGSALYGIPLTTKVAIVNGFHYASRPPVEGAINPNETARSEAESEFSHCVTQAEETFETRRWRAELDQWDDEWKPQIQAANEALREVEPAELDDSELVEHLNDGREAWIEHVDLTFRIFFAYLIPLGDLLAFARQHTDRSPAEIVRLMDGASPDSAGTVEELEAITTALTDGSDARDVLFSEESAEEILSQLRSRDDEVGEAVADWLDIVGYRVLSGFDFSDNYALERPDTLVSTFRAAVKGRRDHSTQLDFNEALSAVRDEVPADDRETFDQRLEEARTTYRVRDERSLALQTTRGLMRRAMLVAGERLVERGRLRDVEHVVDLQHNELVSALQGGPAPSPAEVAVHVQHRLTHDASDAPDQLGSPKPEQISMEDLPEPAARCMRAVQAFGWAGTGDKTEPESEENVIEGLAASAGTYEGPARIVTGPDDFSEIQEGDVLVAEITSPAFNVVLPLVRAIVTDTGGMLSHPSIIAREFGIPGVVGCEVATARIETGQRIEVNGNEGVVRLLGAGD